MAKLGNDDGYAIGPADILFPAIAKFAVDIKEKHLLQLNVRKTEVFSWSDTLTPEAAYDMKVAGVTIEGVFHHGGSWTALYPTSWTGPIISAIQVTSSMQQIGWTKYTGQC